MTRTLPSILILLMLCGCGGGDAQAPPIASVENPAESGTEAAVGSGDSEQTEQQPSAQPPMADQEQHMKWEHSEFGKTADGDVIEQYTLENSAGTVVKLINYGATIVSLETVDKDGKPGNIVLGHSSLEHWLANPCYFGCTVGRYANRISEGVFGLGDNIYTLDRNDGDQHLHGGTTGFHKRLWSAEAASDDTSVTVTFRYTSPDGDDRYPGKLDTIVQYTLNDENELKIHYEATTDKPTIVNLTNHSYWNLTGKAASEDVLKHELRLQCNQYLPVTETLIPTGDMLAVAETPMDFTIGKAIGKDLAEVEGGYDHCFVIAREIEGLAPAARVYEPTSGRVLEISTTEPGIQFYSGNFLNGQEDNGGFGKHHAFCLETQHFPDSPNHPHFPSTVLKPGERYESTTVHRFSVFK
ncbi:MAG: aldose epimerase family protein [Planctomycetaceae bacterium]